MPHNAECSLWKTKSIFIFYVPHIGKNSYPFVVIYNKYLHDFSLYSCISEIKVLRSHWYSSLWWSSIKNIIDQSIVVLAALLEALECCREWWLGSNSSCFCFGPESLGYVWFSENLRENARERKYKGKVEGKEKVKENKKID